jgi:hypothetical protein
VYHRRLDALSIDSEEVSWALWFWKAEWDQGCMFAVAVVEEGSYYLGTELFSTIEVCWKYWGETQANAKLRKKHARFDREKLFGNKNAVD